MLNKMLQFFVALLFILRFAGCSGDSASGVPPALADPVSGTYFGTISDGGLRSGKLTVDIHAFASGRMSGSITLSGVPTCFTTAEFFDATFDAEDGAGIIIAQGSDSSRAILSFTVSANRQNMTINGGVSKFENSQGVPCFIVKSGFLRQERERLPHR
ncbi:hypothetical protein L0222_32545 [bacterium]|nr:hypothetical protein [bacterium]MCI0605312.1 hypothetical protein [bacterium]